MTNRLIGDARPTYLYDIGVDQSVAQSIVTGALKDLGWPLRVRVETSKRRTKRRHGTYFHRTRTILLYPIGMNVGTVIHELSHVWGHGHGKVFKDAHRKLLKMWE